MRIQENNRNPAAVVLVEPVPIEYFETVTEDQTESGVCGGSRRGQAVHCRSHLGQSFFAYLFFLTVFFHSFFGVPIVVVLRRRTRIYTTPLFVTVLLPALPCQNAGVVFLSDSLIA